MMIFSLILSATLFVWEVKGFGETHAVSRGQPDLAEAALGYVRMILVFVCTPFLWGSQLFKWFGWLSHDDMENPNVLQMRIFSWTVSAVLSFIFVWRVVERLKL